MDCKLVLLRKLVGFNQGSKVKWIVSFHLQRAWGFLCNCSCNQRGFVYQT